MTKYLGFQYSDLSGDFFTFQQDNPPADRARETVQLLTCETPDFFAPALWPANNSDLNLQRFTSIVFTNCAISTRITVAYTPMVLKRVNE